MFAQRPARSREIKRHNNIIMYNNKCTKYFVTDRQYHSNYSIIYFCMAFIPLARLIVIYYIDLFCSRSFGRLDSLYHGLFNFFRLFVFNLNTHLFVFRALFWKWFCDSNKLSYISWNDGISEIQYFAFLSLWRASFSLVCWKIVGCFLSSCNAIFSVSMKY